MSPMTDSADLNILGDRYLLDAPIGRGGHGVVYRGRALHTGVPVAIKRLRVESPEALFRLKNEFRALADVRQPNVVGMVELLQDQGTWYVVMELVEGVSFLPFVRPGWRSRTRGVSFTDEQSGSGGPPRRRGGGVLDVARLRSALAQLVRGLAFIHRQGWIHRDVKSSNVIVTPGGRAVIVDLGLMCRIGVAPGRSERGRVVGTPLYLAPELLRRRAATPAADMYAVGVLLFQALFGIAPTAAGQRRRIARPFDDEAPERAVPVDLCLLCARLLATAPESRPSAVEVLRMLADDSAPPAAPPPAAPTVRSADLRFLDDALASLGGSPRVVHLHERAVAGDGGRTLAQAALRRFADAGVLTLQARGDLRQRTPYLAVDGLIDELAQHLDRQSQRRVFAMLPDRGLRALVRRFPTLGMVPAVGTSLATSPEPSGDEPAGAVAAALREILCQVAARHPTVVHVDDMHLADPASFALLTELQRHPRAPAILWLFTSSASATDEVAAEAPGCACAAHVEVRHST